MKMSEIIDFLNIYPEIKNNKIKIQTAYKLSKCIDFCEQEGKFYTTKLSEILEKYGEKDEHGAFRQDPETKGILISPTNKNICEKELNELLNLEVSFDEKLLIDIKELENFELNMDLFRKLKPFLKD